MLLGPTWTFGPTKASISADSWTMLVGVVALVALAITKDLKEKKKDTSLDDNVFSERVARIRKNVPFLMAAGALIALVCNVHVFAGSTVSMFNLADAYASADAAAASQLVKTAAVNEFFRGISFIPLIATTAITTGVYGVAGFTFVYVAGYLPPTPLLLLFWALLSSSLRLCCSAWLVSSLATSPLCVMLPITFVLQWAPALSLL